MLLTDRWQFACQERVLIVVGVGRTGEASACQKTVVTLRGSAGHGNRCWCHLAKKRRQIEITKRFIASYWRVGHLHFSGLNLHACSMEPYLRYLCY